MMDWDDDAEGPEADYGVFGDIDCPPNPPKVFDSKAYEAARKRREAEIRVSQDFNSHMIYLYNKVANGR